MRRNYPPVKHVREPLGAFCDHQFAVHAITLRHESGASSGAPSSPLCAGQPASIPWVAARVRGSIEPAFQRPSRPARCNSPRPATRIRPCPGLGGGGRDLLIVIEPGPSVGLCPNAPRIAVGARAPSPPNSAPGPSAREASSTRSRRTGPRLLPWPYRLLRRQPAPFPLGEDSSLGDPSAAGDPNRGSCTSGIEACGSDCGATNDGYSADTVAPEGCSYTGTRCDPNRPCRQVSL